MTRVADWCAQDNEGEIPKVSVMTITYGHEAFIAETIESVLMQDVDFPVEMVIGEDCSPDGTRDIIVEYMEKYPGLIRLSDYEKNIGAAANFRTTTNRCRGEYLALLDGDDYWTSSQKLRKQVELMDASPEISMCFHPTNLVHNAEIVVDLIEPRGRRSIYKLADIPNGIYIATSSMFCRRQALPDFPPWYDDCFFGDYVLKVLLAEQGDMAYIPELMGSRRLHDGSIWLGQNPLGSESIRLHIETISHICQYLPEELALPFERERRRLYYRQVHAYIDEGQREKAREALKTGYRVVGYDPHVERLEPIRSLVHLYAPPVYRLIRRLKRGRRTGRSYADLVGAG